VVFGAFHFLTDVGPVVEFVWRFVVFIIGYVSIVFVPGHIGFGYRWASAIGCGNDLIQWVKAGFVLATDAILVVVIRFVGAG
jgi:hypothetical protein